MERSKIFPINESIPIESMKETTSSKSDLKIRNDNFE